MSSVTLTSERMTLTKLFHIGAKGWIITIKQLKITTIGLVSSTAICVNIWLKYFHGFKSSHIHNIFWSSVADLDL